MIRRTAIRGARLLDPASGLDARGGLLIEDGGSSISGPAVQGEARRTTPW